jgi:antitoxin (DNA-binding transcriptional repressor) of toxin-antitoxin stability system
MLKMTITVTNFKTHCLKILREVEQSNKPCEISRRGKVRFRIIPVMASEKTPWERLQSHGLLHGEAGESVMKDADFEAAR